MARSTWGGRIYNFSGINGLQLLSTQITWNHVLTRKLKTVNPNFSFPKCPPKVTSDLTLGDLGAPNGVTIGRVRTEGYARKTAHHSHHCGVRSLVRSRRDGGYK